MLRNAFALLLVLTVSTVTFAKDADTFFLLDADSTCISSESLKIDTKAYQQPHGSIEKDAFVTFKNDPTKQSDINDIDGFCVI